MQFFLKAKAWQIFLLSFGIPCCLAVLAGTLTRPTGDQSTFFLLMTPVMALFVGVSLAWYWSLGRFINRRIREDIRPRFTWFRSGMIFVSIYMLVYLCFWVFFFFTAKNLLLAGVMAVIFVFHLLAMAVMIYILYFVSKNLAILTRESGAVTGQSALGNFLLLWFFPIGVWFVQPVVNRIWGERDAAQSVKNYQALNS